MPRIVRTNLYKMVSVPDMPAVLIGGPRVGVAVARGETTQDVVRRFKKHWALLGEVIVGKLAGMDLTDHDILERSLGAIVFDAETGRAVE